ncbi:MAG TPA: type II toxin-antitoxin system VapC family toxin [Acidimicrobiales bacterium]|nr:type II toxin-antitoxin system VapC family toxin [Acidimicrobiales bacterium]
MTDLLLDTHVLLWANGDPTRLGPTTTARLEDPAARLFVSAVSVAEIAIKRSIGKLQMPMPIDALVEALGATSLDLSSTHAAAVEQLPLLHRDPFDRLLAAQSSAEDCTLVTADERLLAYPVTTLDART